MGLMEKLFGERPVFTPAIEPTPTDSERGESLRGQLHAVEEKMAVLNIQMRDFRTRHDLKVDRLMQITGMRSESLTGWKQIETQWRAHLIRRDSLMREFSRAQAMGSIYWMRDRERGQ
jgi:hypothetical protein